MGTPGNRRWRVGSLGSELGSPQAPVTARAVAIFGLYFGPGAKRGLPPGQAAVGRCHGFCLWLVLRKARSLGSLGHGI